MHRLLPKIDYLCNNRTLAKGSEERFWLPDERLFTTNSSFANFYIMKRSIGFLICLILMLISLYCLFNVSGTTTNFAHWFFSLFALWMLHGMYRASCHIRASRRTPKPEDATSEDEACFTRPATSLIKFLRHAYFNPADIHFRTSGEVLILIGALIYALQNGQYFPFYFLLIVMVGLKIFILIQYARLYRLLNIGHIAYRIESCGIISVITTQTREDALPENLEDECIYLSHIPWSNVTGIFFFSKHIKITTRGKGPSEVFLFPSEGQFAKCCDLLRRHFKHHKAKDEHLIYTLENGYRLIDELKLRSYLCTRRIEDDNNAGTIAGISKTGGCPDLGEAFEWPKNEGRNMVHLMQFNMADIHTLDTTNSYPEEGLLNVFIDREAKANVPGEGNQDAVRLVYTPQNESCAFKATPLPEDGTDALQSYPLEFKLQYSVPTYAAYKKQTEQPGINAATYRQWVAMASEPGSTPLDYPQVPLQGEGILGGYPTASTQLPLNDADSHLLLQTAIPSSILQAPQGRRMVLCISISKNDLRKAVFNYIQWEITPTKI